MDGKGGQLDTSKHFTLRKMYITDVEKMLELTEQPESWTHAPQKPSIGPDPDPVQTKSRYETCFLKINFNATLPFLGLQRGRFLLWLLTKHPPDRNLLNLKALYNNRESSSLCNVFHLPRNRFILDQNIFMEHSFQMLLIYAVFWGKRLSLT